RRHLGAGAEESLEESCARAGPGLHLVALDALCAGRLVTRRQTAREDGDAEAERGLARVWLGVPRPGPGGLHAPAAEEAARRLGVPAVAVGEVSFLDPADPEIEELLACVRTNDMLGARPPRGKAAPGHLAAASEETQRWAPFRTLLDNNRRLATDCRVDLELGVPRFPAPTLPPGETGYARLYRLCQEGLARRYATPPRAPVRRLPVELAPT